MQIADCGFQNAELTRSLRVCVLQSAICNLKSEIPCAFHIPIVLLLGAIAIAAALTWVLPAGEYERRDDPSTGRRVAVAGTYHRVEAAPVGPFRAVMAVPRGFAAGIDVVMTILIVGAAWVVVDELGTLRLLVGAIVRRFIGSRTPGHPARRAVLHDGRRAGEHAGGDHPADPGADPARPRHRRRCDHGGRDERRRGNGWIRRSARPIRSRPASRSSWPSCRRSPAADCGSRRW